MKTSRPDLIPRNTRPVRPARPNAGIRDEYRRRLLVLVDEMQASVLWWVRAEYRRQQAKILAYNAPLWRRTLNRIPALDVSPAAAMLAVLRKRMRQWQRTFDERAATLADWFVRRTDSAVTASTAQALKEASGISIKFQRTRAVNNALATIVHTNADMIRSIPQKYFLELEGIIMHSVRSGRDLGGLADDIKKRFSVTRHRAEFIARDQNNKASEAISKARQQSLGITAAVWVHSRASHDDPRHTHEQMDGKPFLLEKGMWDSSVKSYIQPGELPNCRCTKAPLIPSFARHQSALAELEAGEGGSAHA